MDCHELLLDVILRCWLAWSYTPFVQTGSHIYYESWMKSCHIQKNLFQVSPLRPMALTIFTFNSVTVPHFSLSLLCQYVNDVIYGMYGIMYVLVRGQIYRFVSLLSFFKRDPIINLRSLDFHTKHTSLALFVIFLITRIFFILFTQHYKYSLISCILFG